MKAMITGATGFIGVNLARFLVSQNHEVRALCRPTSNKKVFSGIPVEIIDGDILDLSSVERAADSCDCIFHLAGYAKNWDRNPQIYHDINVTGTKNILTAAKKLGVKKVVFTSTCMTYGPSKEQKIDFSRKCPDGVYCEYQRTKIEAEELVLKFVEEGLDVALVHPTRVFGPGLLTEGNSVTKMIQLFLQGKFRILLSDGSAIGNYVYVEDVVQGHWLAFQKGRPGEMYILGGENISLKDFFCSIKDLSQKNIKMFRVPAWLAMAASYVQLFLAKAFGIYPAITPDWTRLFLLDWPFSSEKAQKELGYKMTPFKEALGETLSWLKKMENPNE